jgi:hypothetical protein
MDLKENAKIIAITKKTKKQPRFQSIKKLSFTGFYILVETI